MRNRYYRTFTPPTMSNLQNNVTYITGYLQINYRKITIHPLNHLPYLCLSFQKEDTTFFTIV